MRFIIPFLLVSSLGATNICTPVNQAAIPPNWGAITDGVDVNSIGAYSARLMWTADDLPNPSVGQQIRYCTSGPGCTASINCTSVGNCYNAYYSIAGTGDVQGAVLTNLIPNTTYYWLGLSNQGTTGSPSYCSGTEKSFTTATLAATSRTPALPSVTVPTAFPSSFTNTWTEGSNCTGVQDCINKANPGDKIVLNPASTYSATQMQTYTFPVNPNATAITLSGSTFTYSTTTVAGNSFTPTANEQIKLASSIAQLPNPINPGLIYYIVNLNTGAHTFQVAVTSSGTAVTMVNGGSGSLYCIPWPISQPWIFVTTSSTANATPPFGMRTNPSFVGTMPTLQKTGPLTSSSGQPYFSFGPFASFIWLDSIHYTTQASGDTSTDPPFYGGMWFTNPDNDHIYWTRSYIDPAPPPDRVFQVGEIMGSDNLFLGNYIHNWDYWRYTRLMAGATVVSNTVALPVGTFSRVGTSHTAVTCTNASTATATFTGTTTVTPGFVIYYDASCVLHLDAQTGLTVSGASYTINHVTTPAFPVNGSSEYIGMNVGKGTVSSSVVSYDPNIGLGDVPPYGESAYWTEGSQGFQMDSQAGAFGFVNNYCEGSGVACIFWPDNGIGAGNGCPGNGPCQPLYQPSNALIQRNTFNQSARANIGLSAWDGGNYSLRNGPEVKNLTRYLFDGNIFGSDAAHGWGPGVGAGEGLGLESFATEMPLGQVTWNGDSDGTVSNNTFCYGTGAGIQFGKYEGGGGLGDIRGATPTQPFSRISINNNLFCNLNSYKAAPLFYGQGNPGDGNWIQMYSGMADISVTHNTAMNIGGSLPALLAGVGSLTGGVTFANNLAEYSDDTGHGGLYMQEYCSWSGFAVPCDYPSYNGLSNNAVTTAMHGLSWLNNVMLFAYSDSNPASLTELTSGQISTLQTSLSGLSNFFPSGAALANRLAAINFYSPTNLDFRLIYSSPYISGCYVGSTCQTNGGSNASDGTNVGVDMTALLNAQGYVGDVHVPDNGLTSTTATVAFVAPDGVGCPVDVSTSSTFATWTRYADSGTSAGPRTVSIASPALTTKTPYYYRVDCAVMQPTGEFVTR